MTNVLDHTIHLFNERYITMKSAKDLAAQLIEAAKQLNEDLSQPHNMKLAEQYPSMRRDAQNPVLLRASADVIGKPWNRTPEELLAQGPGSFTFETRICGELVSETEIIKTPDGYQGLPETGAKGPGILGVGHDEKGRPLPISGATDILILSLDDDGRMQALLGRRADTKQRCTIGGFIDENETPRQAASREFIEEAISASFEIDPDLEAAFEQHKDSDYPELSNKEIDALAIRFDIPHHAFDEPAVAEFKYQILKHQNPQAVKDISDFVEGRLDESYKGLVLAAHRNTNDRAISTVQYSAVIEMSELTNILSAHGLNLDAQSAELGKLSLSEINGALLTDTDGSHGPHIMYGIAQALLAGDVKLTPQIETQIGELIAHMNSRHELETIYADCTDTHKDISADVMMRLYKPESEDYERVGEKLSAFTIQAGAPAYDPKPFDFKAYDSQGQVIGELIGNLNWGLAEIELLQVDDAARGQGVGQALMAAAERHAYDKGTVSMRVWTPSFQGSGFYDGALGMKEEYQIPLSVELSGKPQFDHTYSKAVSRAQVSNKALNIQGPQVPKETDYAHVSSRLDDFTATKNAPPYDPLSFAFKAVADNGEIMGELIAKNNWGRVEVELLHVEDHARGKGVGKALMSAAEEFAKASGAVSVMLRTPTWQGAGFYDGALGYQEVARLPLNADIDGATQYEHTYYKDLRP